MQRQAMGVALHIVLLPFFELLHSTIDSYDAGLIESAFFLPVFRYPYTSYRLLCRISLRDLRGYAPAERQPLIREKIL
jgi:hypothetical protein